MWRPPPPPGGWGGMCIRLIPRDSTRTSVGCLRGAASFSHSFRVPMETALKLHVKLPVPSDVGALASAWPQLLMWGNRIHRADRRPPGAPEKWSDGRCTRIAGSSSPMQLLAMLCRRPGLPECWCAVPDTVSEFRDHATTPSRCGAEGGAAWHGMWARNRYERMHGFLPPPNIDRGRSPAKLLSAHHIALT